jgi:hypothetical protein
MVTRPPYRDLKMAHPVGNDPTSQGLQPSANPSQLQVGCKIGRGTEN